MGYIGNVTQSFNVSSTMIEDQAIIPDKIANSGDFAFPADIRLKDADASNYVGFQAPSTVGTNIVWTLPSADAASSGYALVSNASGVLSWAAMSGGGLSSDAQENTVGGTNAGDSFTGTDATNNTLIGFDAGTAITSADKNTFIGHSAGKAVTTGSINVVVGWEAGKTLTTQSQNTYIGIEAGEDSTGSNNTFIGAYTGQVSGSAFSTVYAGIYAGIRATGNQNVGFGAATLLDATGAHNSALGNDAGRSLTSGESNLLAGRQAGNDLTTGSNNVLLGRQAGDSGTNDLTTGSNNIIVGYQAAASAATVSNEVTIGNSSITKFRVPGIDVILKDNGGTPTQGHVLTVDANGEAGFAAASSGGLSSDAQENTVGGTNAGDSFSGTDATDNTLFGYNAGTGITTGDNNTFIGYEAGKAYTSNSDCTGVGYQVMDLGEGDANYAFGRQALRSNTGGQNSAFGRWSLKESTSSTQNAAFGNYSLNTATTGGYNTAIGYEAGRYLTTGHRNTFLGWDAGQSVTTGYYNVYLGYKVAGGAGSYTGANNITIGYDANPSSTSVSNEITFGNSSIDKFRIPGLNFELTAGIITLKNNGAQSEVRWYCESSNAHYASIKAPAHADFSGNLTFTIPSGYGSSGQFLQSNGSGGTTWASAAGGLSSDAQQNTVGGTNAGVSFSGTDATENTLIGYLAGQNITTGDNNTAFGSQALRSATTPTGNVAIGYNALEVNTTGAQNVLMGYNAGYNITTGSNNTGVGGWVLNTNSTGNFNTCMGYGAGSNVSTGSDNTCVGYQSGKWLGSGSYNTGLGMYSLWNTTGNNNTSIGYQAGGAQTSGHANTLIGHKAGYSGTNNLTTGTNNILVGSQATASSATVSNEITLGNSSIDKFRIPGLDGFEIDDNGSIDLPGSIDENVVTITDASSVALDPDQGTIQTWTLGANRTATDSFTTGQSMMLMVADGSSYTVTWPTMTWVGGSAPTLATSGYTVIELWKTGSTLYGAKVGDVA